MAGLCLFQCFSLGWYKCAFYGSFFFFEKGKHAPTTWGPTHELTNNPMGVMFVLLHMLMEAILIAKIVNTEMTPEL